MNGDWYYLENPRWKDLLAQYNEVTEDGAIKLIENARKAGTDVLADAYPYTAYSTTLTIFLDDWAREGGKEAILGRLADPGQRARIRREIPARIESDPGGYGLVVISSVGGGGGCCGASGV